LYGIGHSIHAAHDRDVTLSRSFGETRFAVKTGFALAVGARLTPVDGVQGRHHEPATGPVRTAAGLRDLR